MKIIIAEKTWNGFVKPDKLSQMETKYRYEVTKKQKKIKLKGMDKPHIFKFKLHGPFNVEIVANDYFRVTVDGKPMPDVLVNSFLIDSRFSVELNTATMDAGITYHISFEK